MAAVGVQRGKGGAGVIPQHLTIICSNNLLLKLFYPSGGPLGGV